ncbi:MAG: GrpB family protein [Patescibacteria group bacterium]
MIGLKRGIVKLVPHQKEWANLFEQERKSLNKILGNDIKIEHVGSTAIPGIMAKPIIDIAVGYTDDSQKENIFDLIKSVGYEDMGEKGKIEYRFFAKGPDHNRTHYIHAVKYNSEGWNEMVLFRDFLLKDKEAREDYNKLKKALAEKYSNVREKYTEGKAEFINNILNRAKQLL